MRRYTPKTLVTKALKELDALKERIGAIEELLSEVDAMLESVSNDEEAKLARLRLFQEIAKNGGVMNRKEALDFWQRQGKDPRGFGGLFAYRKGLTKIAGDRVALTEDGYKFLEENKHLLRGDEQTQQTS